MIQRRAQFRPKLDESGHAECFTVPRIKFSLSTERAALKAIIQNEFAMVEVSVDESAPHGSLRIEDLRSGSRIEFDALELEGLTRTAHSELSPLIDPSSSIPAQQQFR